MVIANRVGPQGAPCQADLPLPECGPRKIDEAVYGFESGANDVPISQTCRMIEVELRDLLGETDLPPLLEPKNGIIL